MAEWGYAASNGPATWAGKWPIATSGKAQSPIDIATGGVANDGSLSSLKLAHGSSCCKSVTNTGFTFQVDSDGSGTELSGGPLGGTYKLQQFHAHWGKGGNEGSEHTVDGKTYPAELHLVYYNTKYGDFGSAKDKADGLVIVAAFMQKGKENAALKPITDLFGKIKARGSKADIGFSFDPGSLLPANKAYWTYHGAITIPPLYESVDWIIYKTPVEVSDAQLAAMMSLDTGGDGPLVNNFRPPVPLGGRTVKGC